MSSEEDEFYEQMRKKAHIQWRRTAAELRNLIRFRKMTPETPLKDVIEFYENETGAKDVSKNPVADQRPG